MTKDEMIYRLCSSCGSCCMDVSAAPVTLSDVKRLMKAGYEMEEISKTFVYEEENSMYINAERGCCSALEFRSGPIFGDPGYGRFPVPAILCGIYADRPEVCRKYECHVLQDLQQWWSVRGTGDALLPNDVFFGIFDVDEALKKALSLIPMLRSLMRSMAQDLVEKEDTRKLGKRIQLITTIEPAQFKDAPSATFPSRA